MYGKTFMKCTVILLLWAYAGTADGQELTPMEQLGKTIFFDENLSIDGNQSCASCHGPEVGFTGPLTETNAHGAVYEGSILGRSILLRQSSRSSGWKP